MSFEERLRSVEDRIQIQELMATYSMGVARRDRDAVVACFAPDGVFDVGSVQVEGTEQIREYLRDLRPDRPHLAGFDEAKTTTPLTSNVIIILDGDRASCTSTAVVFHAGSRGGEAIVLVRGTEYDDELQRIEGRWLYARRRHRTVWDYEVLGSAPVAPPIWPRR